jgi:hypothetical protein
MTLSRSRIRHLPCMRAISGTRCNLSATISVYATSGGTSLRLKSWLQNGSAWGQDTRGSGCTASCVKQRLSKPAVCWQPRLTVIATGHILPDPHVTTRAASYAAEHRNTGCRYRDERTGTYCTNRNVKYKENGMRVRKIKRLTDNRQTNRKTGR